MSSGALEPLCATTHISLSKILPLGGQVLAQIGAGPGRAGRCAWHAVMLADPLRSMLRSMSIKTSN